MKVHIVVVSVLSVLLLGASAASAATLQVTVTDQKNAPLEDVVVVATPLASKLKPPGAPRQQIIDQIKLEYVPFVTVIQTTTPVIFPNKDNTRHHVYSFSAAKKFELPLYAGVTAAPVIFDKPGIVVLGCNIHDRMLAYVYVTDSPYHGATGKEGAVDIGGLEAGEYEVQAWHPGLADPEALATQRVRLDASQITIAALRLEVKPIIRGRRAPRPGGGGYR